MSRVQTVKLGARSAWALLGLLLSLVAAGCGSAPTEVTGTVRYHGKPLASGTIQFLASDGIPHSATIQPDGSFIALVPAGSAKVIVTCMDEARLQQFTVRQASKQVRASALSMAAGNFSMIPQRYADWDASGLAVVVARGKSVHDFDLDPN